MNCLVDSSHFKYSQAWTISAKEISNLKSSTSTDAGDSKAPLEKEDEDDEDEEFEEVLVSDDVVLTGVEISLNLRLAGGVGILNLPFIPIPLKDAKKPASLSGL
jgi:hypothetical protein